MDSNDNCDEGKKIIVHIDPDLKELIPEYLENRHQDVRSITQLLLDEDFEKIRLLGHSMKGSGGGYGFDRITEIGKSIEDAAIDKKPETIKNSIEGLTSYLNRVEISYE